MRATSWLVSLAVVSLPALVRADPLECITLHADGQVLRKSGRLKIAREKFLACSAEVCPDLIRRDCTAFAMEIENAQPSISVAARDEANRPIAGALMSVDDAAQIPVPERPLSLDPGQHRIVVNIPGGRSQTASVELREAEKGRLVLVNFDSPQADAPERRSAFAAVPTASYVFGGVALAALGSFTYFGLSGHAKESDFDGCAQTHTCPPGDVREMRHLYLAADVSLGVSIVSLGLGVYFFATQAHAAKPAAAAGRVRWGVTAASSNCLLTAGSSF